MATKKLIKVCLTNGGDDTETPWAHDLGPVEGGRKVKLANVPFKHAKPTWGDTIVVKPVRDGFPTWDRKGVAWEKLETRILVDGGHWAMIVDYEPHPDGKDAFKELAKACAENNIACEGAWAPRDGKRGRTYLAVPATLSDAHVMKTLRAEELPCELVQVHPKPAAPKPKAKKKAPAAKKRSKR